MWGGSVIPPPPPAQIKTSLPPFFVALVYTLLNLPQLDGIKKGFFFFSSSLYCEVGGLFWGSGIWIFVCFPRGKRTVGLFSPKKTLFFVFRSESFWRGNRGHVRAGKSKIEIPEIYVSRFVSNPKFRKIRFRSSPVCRTHKCLLPLSGGAYVERKLFHRWMEEEEVDNKSTFGASEKHTHTAIPHSQTRKKKFLGDEKCGK